MSRKREESRHRIPLHLRRTPSALGKSARVSQGLSTKIEENAYENLPENLELDPSEIPHYVRSAINKNANPQNIINKILSRQGVNMAKKEKLVRFVLHTYTPERLAGHAPKSPSRSRSPSPRSRTKTQKKSGGWSFTRWLFGN
jgi:hypothetical protein